MPATPLTILAIATAAPGGEKTLKAAQEILVAETVNQPGCIRYELHQSLENSRVLIFIESWASEEAWRTHMQGHAIKRFGASGANRLIQDFALYRMVLVADGGLKPP